MIHDYFNDYMISYKYKFDYIYITHRMPEGPEVIITTQYLKSKLLGKYILSLDVISGRYTHEKLKGKKLIENERWKIKKINSKGKFIWFELQNDLNDTIYLLNTLGLTGVWSFTSNNNSRVEITVVNSKNKIYKLYYVDARNFGTIEITDDFQILKSKLDKLAPDVLKTNFDDDSLKKLIKKYAMKHKTINIVKILINQSAIVSGIGNYLVAEILYDAKINPHRNLSNLTDPELFDLAKSIRKICKLAYYNNNTGYMKYYEKFMKTHSKKIISGTLPNYHPDIVGDNFKFNVYQQKKDPLGNIVARDEIIKGRTIHWVPTLQK